MCSASHFEGSSPLARGLPEFWDCSQVEVWIIPARAGFTVDRSCDADGAEDHPRSRGVYWL